MRAPAVATTVVPYGVPARGVRLSGLRGALASPGSAVAGVIVVATAVRLLMGATLGLGIDESYMVAAGRTFRWGYFDHPPLAWWLAAGAARLAGSEADLLVRLPFIALFALSTWLMWRFAGALFGPRAGVLAAVALNLSPVFAVATGGWVLPDGPLTCALLAASLCLVRALPDGRGRWRWWLGAGAAAGLALLSKYSAALTLAGALVYLLTQPAHRVWLRRPHPYAAALLALAGFAPVVWWNATHGWASFTFQGGRADAVRFNPLGPLVVLGGEALYVLPWIWLPMMLAFGRALRAGPAAWRTWLPCCLGAGPILLFAAVALWSQDVLFHWAAPGYLMLFPLLGAALDRWLAWRPRAVRAALLGTAALLIAGLALVESAVRWNWPPIVLEAFPPDADPGLQALDWTALPKALAARGLLDRPGTVVAALNWREAGKIDYALGGAVPVICLSRDQRQYGLSGIVVGADAPVLIVATKPVTTEQLAANGFGFETLTPLPPVPLPRKGRPGAALLLYLGSGLAAL